MTGHTEKVAIAIAAYNAAPTIARAVRSALAQPEVGACIVIDDASRDDTIAAARQADDGSGRLTIISQTKNQGPAAARNAVLGLADCDWIGILDSDDFMLPGRVGQMLASSADADFIADDLMIVPEGSENESQAMFDAASAASAASNEFSLDLTTFVCRNISRPGQTRGELGFLKPLMRRSFLATNALRYDPALRLGEDYAFYVNALLAGARFRIVGPAGYVAVERPTSISARHSAEDLDALVAFDTHCLRNPRLTAAERDVLREHRAAVRQNAEFRHALQVRAERGLIAGLAYAARHPHSLPHMVEETLRARARSRQQNTSSRARFLIGGYVENGLSTASSNGRAGT